MAQIGAAVAAGRGFPARYGRGAGLAGGVACGGHGAFGQAGYRAGCGPERGAGDFGTGRTTAYMVVAAVRGELCGGFAGGDHPPYRGRACGTSGGVGGGLGGITYHLILNVFYQKNFLLPVLKSWTYFEIQHPLETY